MLSDQDRITVHKLLVTAYMKGKMAGINISKHEESFKDSVEFLKQNGIKVGPDEFEKIKCEPIWTWSRHQSSSTGYFQTEYHHNE